MTMAEYIADIDWLVGVLLATGGVQMVIAAVDLGFRWLIRFLGWGSR